MNFPDYHPFRSAESKKRYLALNAERAKSWPVVFENRLVDTSYGQTFLRISGPKDAAPLVLLPGARASSLMWEPNIEGLSKSYCTYSVDYIDGHGLSVYSQKPKNVDAFIRWMDELLNGLGLNKDINLVGVSYGGWFASQYALSFPNRLAKIVMLAPAGTILRIGPRFIARGMLSLAQSRFKLNDAFWDWFFKDSFAKGGYARKFAEQSREDTLLESKYFKLERMIMPTVLTNEQLRGIKVTTLIMYGENEVMCSAQKAVKRINKIAPEIKTKILPNCGHDLTVAQAELVNDNILRFLR